VSAPDITGARLHNQRLSSAGFAKPEDVVGWLGAVQAQDYAGAKWALALRMRRPADTAVERASATGAILRTHVMRPTWHFVTPADIRWLLALTAPRVKARMASYDRALGLDAAVFRRSHKVLARALRDGVQLTREELKIALERAGVAAGGVQRLAHLVMRAELDGLICSGARRGKQFTYALLDERVPASRALTRDEALAELARRYFTSHGPAQLRDFAWWSGLAAADARAGLAMAESHLVRDVIDGKTYWFSPSTRTTRKAPRHAYLLPLYDEYLIAYKDRSAALGPAGWARIAEDAPFIAPIVMSGRVVGGWTRRLQKHHVLITIAPLAPFTVASTRAIRSAAHAYADFLGLNLALA
jgi:hypothetical protein